MEIITAADVADYFLANVDEDSGDNMTHLKLQKLLYYAQGFSFGMTGRGLFPESVEAWDHGPVVRDIFYRYQGNMARPIHRPREFDISRYAPEVRELLDAVHSVYGQFTAWKLRDMTHEEPPWKNTARNMRIADREFLDFFGRIFDAGFDGLSLPGEPVWPSNSFRHQRRKTISGRTFDRDNLRRILGMTPSPDPWFFQE